MTEQIGRRKQENPLIKKLVVATRHLQMNLDNDLDTSQESRFKSESLKRRT